MRRRVVSYHIGLFLRIFSVLLLVPIVVGRYYGESFVVMEPFLVAAFVSIVLGAFLTRIGTDANPGAVESMAIATGAWILGVGVGAIPIYTIADVPLVDAYFDAMAGMTTTGMVILPSEGSVLPYSLRFWRVFMQWIGGLGILTFFVMVLAESGTVAARLVSQEANKTDSGVIRPSLFNAIKSMWYVYIVLTVVQALLLYYFDIPWFHAVGHAMTTLPTGGFSTTADFAGMLTPGAAAVFTVFMIAGGTNFLLLYALFQGDVRKLLDDYEFKRYMAFIGVTALLIAADAVLNADADSVYAFVSAVFHSASIISSTGFTLDAVYEMPAFTKALILLMMFVGGSLGSTTGGFKVLRLGVMIQIVEHHIRSLTRPPTVMNRIMVKGRILNDREIVEIASFFFLWLAVIFVGGLVTVWLAPMDVTEALQLMTSAVGTMGPTFVTGEELRMLPAGVKIAVSLGMLAGRLEMLPLLALTSIAVQKRLL